MKYDYLVTSRASLQSYWKLDEPSGNAADSGPGAHAGTVGVDTVRSANPILATSQSTASMGFGTTTKNVAVGDFYDFAGVQAFTVLTWARLATSGTTAAMVTKRGISGGLGTTDGWRLLMNASGTVTFQRRVASTNTSAITTATLTTSALYMIAGTYDGTSNRVYVYLNGSLVEVATTADGASLINTGGSLTIGGTSPAGVSITEPWLGDLDNVAVFNEALPQAVLTRLHTVGFRQQQAARIAF